MLVDRAKQGSTLCWPCLPHTTGPRDPLHEGKAPLGLLFPYPSYASLGINKNEQTPSFLVQRPHPVWTEQGGKSRRVLEQPKVQ